MGDGDQEDLTIDDGAEPHTHDPTQLRLRDADADADQAAELEPVCAQDSRMVGRHSAGQRDGGRSFRRAFCYADACRQHVMSGRGRLQDLLCS